MSIEAAEWTADDLAQRLDGCQPLFVLDVRNAEEYANWRIEGREPLPQANVPYFMFLMDEAGELDRLPWAEMEGRETVVVCAKGGASDYVAGLLRGRGVAAVNLAGGMLAWSQFYRVRVAVDEPRLTILQVQRPGKGCLSYLVASGGEALVVDAGQRVDVYTAEAARRGWTVRAVADTHLHADHLSGGRELAALCGCDYLLAPADAAEATFAYRPLEPGMTIELGAAAVPVVALPTPGHTPGSTCLRADDRWLLTGDTLFLAGIGRPDLGGRASDWVEGLYDTIQGRLRALPGSLVVLPGHYDSPREQDGLGRFMADLATCRTGNGLLAPLERQEFRRRVLSSMPERPANHETIREINGGLRPAAAGDDRIELEIGPNRCAAGQAG